MRVKIYILGIILLMATGCDNPIEVREEKSELVIETMSGDVYVDSATVGYDVAALVYGWKDGKLISRNTLEFVKVIKKLNIKDK